MGLEQLAQSASAAVPDKGDDLVDDMDREFLDMAKKYSSQSTCKSRKIGVIITEGDIESSSANNSPPSDLEVCEACPYTMSDEYEDFKGCIEPHPEIIAMLLAGHDPDTVKTMYIDGENYEGPCHHCMLIMLFNQISELVYREGDGTIKRLTHADLMVRTRMKMNDFENTERANIDADKRRESDEAYEDAQTGSGEGGAVCEVPEVGGSGKPDN